MGLGGAIIGGIIGAVFGGGWGAALGAVIGGSIGGNGDERPDSTAIPDNASEHAALEAWETLFQSFGKIAKSDGVVSREEADLVGAFLRQTGLPAASRKQLIAAFNAGKRTDRPFSMLARAVANSFSPEHYRQIMSAYCDLVLADGAIDEREVELLRVAEAAMEQRGFVDRWLQEFYGDKTQERTGRQKQPPPPPPHSESRNPDAWAYELLGIRSDATNDEVKKAWRNKAKEYHPDILRGKGVEESVVKLAEVQMRRVNDAYETIRKSRGF